ncbi:hypothetical protein NEF87_002784 [Candidatus Lokiarchaeum ossiferum]|uniref:Uncharacterized protein n=1 Tax=Candidatus Lokiarchaeum ossiferum TaxID=2951803 RepID=A0ABY6HVL7_9ARCH|nr:hypothetical protein NEF87_002784 [Candidatus Lokiarchaeum sp. B-35]
MNKPHKKCHFEINLGSAGISRVSVYKDDPIDSWPFEMKLEFLNMMLLFRSVGLLPERIYQKKYRTLVEKYEEDMLDLKQWINIKRSHE